MKQIYKIQVEETPPRRRIRFDLDWKITPTRYKSKIVRSIREAKYQHKLNGAAYTYSTYLTSFDDNTLTMKRAIDILSNISFDGNRKYTLDVIYTSMQQKMSNRERKQLDKQIRYYKNRPDIVDALPENTAATWKIFHHHKRVSHGGSLFVLTKTTKPGTLVEIDNQY
ncbi:hypothetical protein ACJMK2_025521 [Sinanodonta woodiana]|uniref:Uncharacterized protein n=1 Tax=Sinanodonta woodiana TaxID=1069815 RepID=A0ABD3XIA7_SINWO